MQDKKLRGFASMTAEVRKELASKGGKAAWASGKAHSFGSNDFSREAGRKGGISCAAKKAAAKAAKLAAEGAS